MAVIHVLDEITVDKIAAGEVVERPSSVVKELVENSIDAGADIITVEIKDGGTSLIRVTDNGSGIEKGQITKAFLRHATSKIQTEEDLETIHSLGFRGEALSSISAVCQVELITKISAAFVGTRIQCNGGRMEEPEDVGAPDGTTVVARNIFFNTPARRKFLKTNMTEAGYIGDLMQRIALSKPDISFKFISNGQTKFYTSGNGDVAEIIYRLYGKEAAANLIPIEAEMEGIQIKGYLGKPVLNRASRTFEIFFVNGRYVKSRLFSAALEEGCRQYVMQHKYPFAVLYFTIDTRRIDVNVHPTKMEIRITGPETIGKFFSEAVKDAMSHKDFIPRIMEEEKETRKEAAARERLLTKEIPEPFETKRAGRVAEAPSYQTVAGTQKEYYKETDNKEIDAKETGDKTGTPKTNAELFFEDFQPEQPIQNTASTKVFGMEEPSKLGKEENIHSNIIKQKDQILVDTSEQLNLFDDSFFNDEAKEEYRILGQIFKTYWLVTLKDKLYIIDQHAAHEKVMYEIFMKKLKEGTVEAQLLNPPVIVTLSDKEKVVLKDYEEHFSSMGFEIEEFGGDEFALRAVPSNLYGYGEKELFLETIDELLEFPVKGDNHLILQKLASMSCKAAVKGGQDLSMEEAKELVDTLFTLENPYHCPHGRPTIISMSKYEIEKKFKRIVS
ncbi:MAG: DNA mismatch repair endonuclease MutL [Lachnospiraceae bacterium]|nr:DNA mismatch repair endonuclease MutL [Lachnospiraceae bacterium]